MKTYLEKQSLTIGWLNGWAGVYTVHVPSCPYQLLANYLELAGAAATGGYAPEAEA